MELLLFCSKSKKSSLSFLADVPLVVCIPGHWFDRSITVYRAFFAFGTSNDHKIAQIEGSQAISKMTLRASDNSVQEAPKGQWEFEGHSTKIVFFKIFEIALSWAMFKLQMFRGDDRAWAIEFLQDGGTDPEDITGWELGFTVKQRDSDPDAEALIQKFITTHVDAANGKTAIVVDAADTQDLEGGAYVYDLQVIDGAGKIRTATAGPFIINTDITRGTEAV